MRLQSFLQFGLLASSFAAQASAAIYNHTRRQAPQPPNGLRSISSPNGYQIRYKEPSLQNVCETTPGVKSYSGYIDLNKNSHTFFWFFEARHEPETAPITMWINGGPGSDSLIGLFSELGPCKVTPNLTTVLNDYSWNNYSNLLFISQPLGTGFSYSTEEIGMLNWISGSFESAQGGALNTGRFPDTGGDIVGTSTQAAVAAWEVLQAFYTLLPKLDGKVKSREFHLWTESFGGHYGPAFYEHFSKQNDLIKAANSTGTKPWQIPLEMASLGIGNGLIDNFVQAPSFAEFAHKGNPYGIEAVNKTVYDYMNFALRMKNGCLEQLVGCKDSDHSKVSGKVNCIEAMNMCRDNVEGPYYSYSERGTYDIRHPTNDPDPPEHYVKFLNLASTQDALGVDLNYTSNASEDVFYAFAMTGDYAYHDYIGSLHRLLDNNVRVHLYYGDADYICNWLGGEAVANKIGYDREAAFRNATYLPFIHPDDGKEYGAVKQVGNFSFMRVYDAGHQVPFYQPKAAAEMFRRVISGLDVATGKQKVSSSYETFGGAANATHTQTYWALPASTSTSAPATASSVASGVNGTIVVPPPVLNGTKAPPPEEKHDMKHIRS